MNTGIFFHTIELKEILSIAQSISNKKTISENANTCTFTIEEKEGYIETSDLENTLKIYIEQKFMRLSGKNKTIIFSINSKKFYELIKEIEEAEIFVEILQNSVKIISSNSETTLSIYKNKNIALNEFSEIENFTIIDSKTLKDSINFISPVFSTSTNSNLASKETSFIEFCESSSAISFSATDGHCLAHITTAIKKIENFQFTNKKKEFVVSKKSIIELKKIIESCKKDTMITIGQNNNSIIFSNERFILKIRETNIKFPNYKKIILLKDSNIASCSLNSLLSGIKRAVIIADGENTPAEITINKHKKLLTLCIEKNSLGGIQDRIAINFQNEENEISKESNLIINVFPSYIQKAILALETISKDTPDIQIVFSSAEKPLKFFHQAKTESESFYLIMPMKQTKKPISTDGALQ